MRSLLGVLMVLAVSADDEVNIPGFAGESVLLRCNCTGIKPPGEFQWQMESDLVMLHNLTYTGFFGRFKGRAEIFLNDRENCSLLLRNLNANDTGIYRCSFNEDKQYRRCFRNLKVSGIAIQPLVGETSNGCIQFFKIIPIVLLLGFSLVCGAVMRE